MSMLQTWLLSAASVLKVFSDVLDLQRPRPTRRSIGKDKMKGRSVPQQNQNVCGAATRGGAARRLLSRRRLHLFRATPPLPRRRVFAPNFLHAQQQQGSRSGGPDLLCSCLACVQAATDEKGKPRRKGRLCTSRPGEKAGAVGEACLNSSHTSRSPPYGCLPCPPLAPRIFPKRQVAAHNSFSAIFISKTMCLSSLH